MGEMKNVENRQCNNHNKSKMSDFIKLGEMAEYKKLESLGGGEPLSIVITKNQGWFGLFKNKTFYSIYSLNGLEYSSSELQPAQDFISNLLVDF